MKKYWQKFIVAGIAIILAVTTVIVYYAAFVPKGAMGDKNVTVRILYKENNFSYNVNTSTQTIYELLKEMNDEYELHLETEEGYYGEYITSLKGVKQDEDKGYYYIYTVTGFEFASGISTQTFKDGDTIEFKYLYTEYDENWNVISQELIGKGQTANYEKIKIIIICVASALALFGIAYAIAVIIGRNRNEKRN